MLDIHTSPFTPFVHWLSLYFARWKVYVRGVNGQSISPFVEKVIFNLDPSFRESERGCLWLSCCLLILCSYHQRSVRGFRNGVGWVCHWHHCVFLWLSHTFSLHAKSAFVSFWWSGMIFFQPLFPSHLRKNLGVVEDQVNPRTQNLCTTKIMNR